MSNIPQPDPTGGGYCQPFTLNPALAKMFTDGELRDALYETTAMLAADSGFSSRCFDIEGDKMEYWVAWYYANEDYLNGSSIGSAYYDMDDLFKQQHGIDA